jgi:hypothetical protein
MGADYTVGGLFVNWPIPDMRPSLNPSLRFREAAAIVRREKSF